MNYTEVSLKNRLTKSIYSNLFAYFVLLPIGFIITPLFLKDLGQEIYGIWILGFTLFSFFRLADINLNIGLTKFIPQYYIKKDYTIVNKFVSTAFVAYLVLALILFGIFILSLDWIIVNFFSKSTVDEGTLRFFLKIIFLIFTIDLFTSSFSSVFYGLQRLEIKNILGIIREYFWLLVFLIVLKTHGGLKLLVISLASLSFVNLVAIIILIRKLFPEIKYNIFLFDFKVLKELLKFSSKIFVGTISSVVNFHVDKIILSFFVGTEVVTFYQIGFNLATGSRKFVDQLLPSIIPAASELFSARDKTGLKKLYLRANRYLFFVTIPFVFGVFAFGPAFIRLWLKGEYPLINIALFILTLTYFWQVFTGPICTFFYGIGEPEYPMYNAVLTIILNISLSYLLCRYFGYTGVLFGTFISIFISVAIIKLIFFKITKFSYIEMLKFSLFKPFLASVFCLFVIFLTYYFIEDFSFLVFIPRVVVFCVFYFVFLRLLKYFDEVDKEIFSKYIPQPIVNFLL